MQTPTFPSVGKWQGEGENFLLLSLLVVVLLLGGRAGGQMNQGYPAWSAFDPHGTDTINLQNLNIAVGAPVMSKTGAIPLTVGIVGNSGVYVNPTDNGWVASMGGTGQYLAPGNTLTGTANGFLGTSIITPNTHVGVACPGSGYTTKFTNWTVIGADGTSHPFPVTDYADKTSGGTSCLSGSGFTDATIDGSGITMTVSATGTVGNIVLKDGTLISASQIKDVFGNTVTLSGSSVTDSLGTAAVTLGIGGAGPFTWTDINSGSPQVSMATTQTTLQTYFQCTGISEGSSYAYPVTAIDYPDGTSIALTYENSPIAGNWPTFTTGRLASLTLRTRGTITYAYSGSNNGINCTYGVPPTLKRTNSDGTTTYNWAAVNNGGGNWGNTTTLTDPGGNVAIYSFTGLTSTGVATFPTTQALTQVQHKQGSSTLLSTDVYCYNTAFTSCSFTGAPTAVVTLPVTSLIIFHQIGGMTNTSATEYHYDKYGNVTDVKKYDFGSSSPATEDIITYGTCTAGCTTSSPTINSSIGSGVNNLAGRVEHLVNGNIVGDERFARNSQGEVTTRYAWTGSSYVYNATANTYNSNGRPGATYDLANNKTAYSYSTSSYYYTGCPSGGCTTYPFATTITKGGLTTGATWNAVGGVKTADVDANGIMTKHCYNTGVTCNSGGTADPFWRMVSSIDYFGNQPIVTYPTGSAPNTSETSFSFNSGNSVSNLISRTDGYGRVVNTQKQQGPSSSSYDTVSASYGWSGNYFLTSTSEPCSASLSGTCTTVHTKEVGPKGLYQTSTTSNEVLTHSYTQNDDLIVLSPPSPGENNKQVQNQYDGLGRLQYSCAIGNGSTTPCGQSTGTQNGLTTSYSYTSGTGTQTTSITRGSQTRSMKFDAMGRLTQKSTPEGGTWNYYYDTAACANSGASPGNMTCSTDPNGVTTVYFYDSLNRLHDVNAIGSHCKRFRYDSGSNAVTGTVPAGVTLANVSGRLVEAETDNCINPITPITDEWFSYDQDGRMTDMWELTPHSTQYYHSVATYFENGKIKTLQLASPSLYTMTWGLDGEGRWNTLTDTTSGKALVTGATFFPAANPAIVSLTGTAQDSFTVDQNTGRMTQYVFTVGSSNMTGNLAWNPNGMLKQLAITDGFNSGGTQTCNFNPIVAPGTGYDDLGRLVGVDCGSGQWGQTFSYDIYDNLGKSASFSGRIGTTWLPGYSATTNHCNGCTYDADGNVTGDGNNVYGWDGFSNLTWTAPSGIPTCGTSGRCITYDAFGRMVERSDGSTWYTQWILAGATAWMSGTTINFAFWPAPSGGTVLIGGNSNGFNYLHKDWLGNVRITSNLSSNTVTRDQAYSPYSELYDAFGAAGQQYTSFAGLKGDFDYGVLWDTPNRELSIVGRWLSPDPAGVGWNQYAYTTNPNSLIDPSGLSAFNPVYFPSNSEGYGSFEYSGVPWGDGGPFGDGESPFSGSSSAPTSTQAGEGGGLTQSGISAFAAQFGANAAAAWVATIFQSTPQGQGATSDADDEDDLDPEIEWGHALEPLKPGETAWPTTAWRYNMLEPGPLQIDDAATFGGGQYNQYTVGEGGLAFDTPFFRVYGSPDTPGNLAGPNGSWYALVPQVGGIQSMIDLALVPPGANSAENSICVYFAPGTTIFVGPISSQGGFALGGGPGFSGLQVFVPRPGYQFVLPHQ